MRILKLTFRINELDDTDNVFDNGPSRDFLVHHVAVYGVLTGYKQAYPVYKKLKYLAFFPTNIQKKLKYGVDLNYVGGIVVVRTK